MPDLPCHPLSVQDEISGYSLSNEEVFPTNVAKSEEMFEKEIESTS